MWTLDKLMFPHQEEKKSGDEKKKKKESLGFCVSQRFE